jgi:hypothetical protein
VYVSAPGALPSLGRAKFDFRGRPFVWWVDGDFWLRIASLDKRFVVAYALGRTSDQPPVWHS